MSPTRAMPYRVLYVDLAPAVGGSVISLYHLVKGLDRERFEPVVVMRASNAYAAEFERLGVQIIRLGSDVAQIRILATSERPTEKTGLKGMINALRSSSTVRWLKHRAIGERLVHFVGFYLREFPNLVREARILARIIARIEPDLVHLNDVVCVSRSGILAACWTRVPAICHLRALAWRNHFDRLISRSLKGYICISHAVDHYQRCLGGRTSPSWVVYNGTDMVDLAELPSREQARQAFGWTAEHVVVGSVGRLVRWKGQDVFVRALALLAKRYPQLRALIVGGQASNEPEFAEQLHDLVREAGLLDVVCFTGHRQDLLQVLRAMDIMVHSSVTPEPFGRVLIEAMAAGVAVIGSDAGAVPEIVEHDVNGLLVPPGDPLLLAEAIEHAMLSSGDRVRWQLAAQLTVVERFTSANYVAGVQSVYGMVLSD